MADEEYAIYMIADCHWPSAIDLTSVTYDRALFLESDVVGMTVEALSTADRAAFLESEPNLKLEATATRDAAFWLASDLQQVKLDPTVTKDVMFELDSEPNPLRLAPNVSIDYNLVADADAREPSLVCDATFDAAIAAMTADVEGFQLQLSRMVRSIFEPPPDAAIFVLKYATSEEGEINFDRSTVEAGVTTVLRVEILGTRLNTYLIEFFVRSEDGATPSIYKSSDGKPGGIRVLGINAVASPNGTRQQAIAQIVLGPEDTAQFHEATTALYELRMSNRGFGEDYRVAPKRERGDTGTFTISVG